MTNSKYRPEDYPNLWWVVTRDLARCKNPDKTLAALLAVAGPILEREEGRQHE